MQIAEILSDLTSLRACDHSAAMALVSARPFSSTLTREQTPAATDENDKDLARARDLVDLHYSVKVAHREGRLEGDLLEAKEMVMKALASLK